MMDSLEIAQITDDVISGVPSFQQLVVDVVGNFFIIGVLICGLLFLILGVLLWQGFRK